MNGNVLELYAEHVRYFSSLDEASFFHWLKNISCVVKFEGKGHTLFISIDVNMLDDDMLREIIGLFMRYKVSMKQLSIITKYKKFSWLKNKNSYWYDLMFS